MAAESCRCFRLTPALPEGVNADWFYQISRQKDSISILDACYVYSQNAVHTRIAGVYLIYLRMG